MSQTAAAKRDLIFFAAIFTVIVVCAATMLFHIYESSAVAPPEILSKQGACEKAILEELNRKNAIRLSDVRFASDICVAGKSEAWVSARSVQESQGIALKR